MQEQFITIIPYLYTKRGRRSLVGRWSGDASSQCTEVKGRVMEALTQDRTRATEQCDA
jgi:hypothetical protein